MLIPLNEVHVWKADSPIDDTVFGITKVSKDTQSMKALYPMDSITGVMETDVSDLHPLNMELPIVSVPFSIIAVSRDEQPSNTALPRYITVLGIVTVVREEQPENAPVPTEVTDEGMVMERRDEQPANCESAKDSILLPRVMDVSVLPNENPLNDVSPFPMATVSRGQGWNAPSPTSVTESGMTMWARDSAP